MSLHARIKRLDHRAILFYTLTLNPSPGEGTFHRLSGSKYYYLSRWVSKSLPCMFLHARIKRLGHRTFIFLNLLIYNYLVFLKVPYIAILKNTNILISKQLTKIRASCYQCFSCASMKCIILLLHEHTCLHKLQIYAIYAGNLLN